MLRIKKGDQNHPEYNDYIDDIIKTKDCYKGQTAIDRKSNRYLTTNNTRKEGEPHYNKVSTEIKQRKSIYSFENFTSQSVDDSAGVLFSTSPTFRNVPERYLNNIDRKGTPADIWVEKSGKDEMLSSNECWLVNYMNIDNPQNRFELERSNNRAYVVKIPAEQVTNWNAISNNILGDTKYDFVEITSYRTIEEYNERTKTNKKTNLTIKLILKLDNRGHYYQVTETYDQNGTNLRQRSQRTYPERNGQRLDFIPFGRFNDTFGMENPLMLPVANADLNLYNSNAQLNFAQYKTLTSYKHYRINTEIDAEARENFEASVADWDGVSNISTNSNVTIHDINADVGNVQEYRDTVRMHRNVATTKAGVTGIDVNNVQSPEALRIRLSTRNSRLRLFAKTFSNSLTKMINIMLWWDGIDVPEAEIIINPDFDMNMVSETVNENINVTEAPADVPNGSN